MSLFRVMQTLTFLCMLYASAFVSSLTGVSAIRADRRRLLNGSCQRRCRAYR